MYSGTLRSIFSVKRILFVGIVQDTEMAMEGIQKGAGIVAMAAGELSSGRG